MLEAEFRHDIQKNYLVVQGKEKQNYMLHMLAGKQIQGFLPLEVRELNNQKEYYYDITGKKSLEKISQSRKWGKNEIKKYVAQILTEIGKCKEYLLNPDHLVLETEYMYVDEEKQELSLCYVFDYEKKIGEQLCELFTELMNIVDYKDKLAVQMVYKLFEVSREEGCILKELWKILSIEAKDNIQNVESLNEVENKKEEENILVKGNKRSLVSGLKKNDANKKEILFKNEMEDKRTEKVKKGKNLEEKRKLSEGENRKTETENKLKKKENMALIGIVQVAFLMLIVVASKTGLFMEINGGVSIGKAVAGLMMVGAADVFIMGRILSAELEEENEKAQRNKGEENGKIKNCKKETLGKKKLEQRETLGKNLQRKKNPEEAKEDMIFEEKDRKEEHELREEYVDSLFLESDLIKEIMKKKREEKICKKENEKKEEKKANSVLVDGTIKEEGTVIIDYDKTVYKAVEDITKWKCLLVPENKEEETIQLGEFPFFIGRFQKDTGCLGEKKNISRMHSKIEQMGEEYFITDLNSTNGTFVNEKRVEKNTRIALKEGDKVSFADIPYYFTKEKMAS